MTLVVAFQLLMFSSALFANESSFMVAIDRYGVAQTYSEHDFIAILGNDDLLSQASTEGWIGTGSAEDPIVISGYHIQDERHLFRIVNTDLYFIFRNNLLDGISGIWCGLYLANVTNGVVTENIVKNAAIGIHVVQIYNCSIDTNEIFDNYVDGIVLELPCTGNNLTDNQIYSNDECGIILDYGCQNNLVANNIIHDNGDTGIFLWQAGVEEPNANNTIIGNHIARHIIGVSVQGFQNLILNNTIEEASRTGILCNGHDNTFRENIITNGGRDGINLYSYASENFIVLNSVSNNTRAGLKAASSTENNTIRHNDFILNNESLQVSDDGKNNEMEMNYYSNWNSPDNDHDNYVDYAFPVFGNANNTDAHPFLQPNVHYLEDWYIQTQALATTSESSSPDNLSAALIFILPVSGVILILVIGVLYPKK